MKKIFFIIAVLYAAAFWLPGCAMKGGPEHVSDYIYMTTPSPTVTVTVTPAP